MQSILSAAQMSKNHLSRKTREFVEVAAVELNGQQHYCEMESKEFSQQLNTFISSSCASAGTVFTCDSMYFVSVAVILSGGLN